MDKWLKARLEELDSKGLLRDPEDSRRHLGAPPLGGEWLDACSNDYLGLGAHTVSRETLDSLLGARIGASASRLVQGSFEEHAALEAELARWVGTEACLTTSSAFAANCGLIPALASDSGSLVVSDALNHASIVDGCRLARGKVVVTPHLDLAAVEAALGARSSSSPAWVITEGLFSMDGDRPDLGALRGLCDRFGAGLIVDEAHSLGVVGPDGAGVAALHQVRPDVLVAGLGKAVGSQGGFIAGTRSLQKWAWNRVRSFVFSTATSPLLSRFTLSQVLAAKAASAQRTRLQSLSTELREALRVRGLPVANGASGPIIPLILGSNERALLAMARLRQRGILVQAIRPPTVPQGEARLRITVHADWGDDAVPRLVRELEAVCAS